VHGVCLHEAYRQRESEYNRGTGCGKTARPGLCRGLRVTGVPTADAHKMIHKLLTLLFRRRKPNIEKQGEEALLNYALDLAQEWGDEWLEPIQERLSMAYPNFTREELDKYNAIAQDAMKYGHDLVYSMAEKQGKDIEESKWKETYLSRYPWVDSKNLKHLFSTGRYYAWKDGVAQ
jgi:hypothetical protein